MAGFRRVSTGDLTARFDPLVGLDTPQDPLAPTAALRARVKSDPCAALFGPVPADPPLAVFSDYNCPICRRFEADLARLSDRRGDLPPPRWLELPLLGPGSVAAARLALAADLQGAYGPMRAALLRSPGATRPGFARALAGRLGLDADRLIHDADSTAVTARLQRVRALAGLFGVAGTPAFALGDLVVIGAPDPRQLDRMAEERRPAPCARA